MDNNIDPKQSLEGNPQRTQLLESSIIKPENLKKKLEAKLLIDQL